ncbi:phosphatidylglycerol lysyltransferase domain-containing protein [Litchfieldia salsa]|nr:phosphatidylglycerol lysyltransferase domain-containing protein [Litchfieldia salsa]
MMSVILIALILIIFLCIGDLKFKKVISHNQEERNEIMNFIEQCGGNHTSHLYLLGDKNYFWSQQKRVLITYQRITNMFVVLGDPLGDQHLIKEAMNEFNRYCNQQGVRKVYYQVSHKHLSLYKDEGLLIKKVGEEAKVYIPDHSLTGKKMTNIRTNVNKCKRSGYHFEIYTPPHHPQLLLNLKEVSDSWLGDRKEKSFSIGYFEESYLSHFPIAVVSQSNGTIMAFASLAEHQELGEKLITIDLMRYRRESLSGTMDFLFSSILNWCSEEEYTWCSLGNSPLANIANKSKKGWYETVANYMFTKSKSTYNFKGLFEYKDKFKPKWDSRYLIYEKKYGLLLVILNLILLINRRVSIERTQLRFPVIPFVKKMRKVG